MVQGSQHQVVHVHPDRPSPVRRIVFCIALAMQTAAKAEGPEAIGSEDLAGPEVVQL